MNYAEINRKAFDNETNAYAVRNAAMNAMLRRKLDDFSAELPSKRVLDVACGHGREAAYLSSRGYRVHGIDISERMLAIARKTAPGATFEHRDFTTLDEKDAYDGVWCNAGLFFVPKDVARDVLARFSDALRPAGVLYVSIKEGMGGGVTFDEKDGVEKYKVFYTPDEIVGMVETAGFSIIRLYDIDQTPGHPEKWFALLARKP